MLFIISILTGCFFGVAINFISAWAPWYIENEEREWIAEVSGLDVSKKRLSIAEYFCSFSWCGRISWFLITCSIIMSSVVMTHYGLNLKSFAWIFFFSVLITLAITDIKTQYLPDLLTLPTLWLGMLLQLFPLTKTIGIEASVTGAAIGYLLLWAIAFLHFFLRRQDGLGHGDMKLMAMLGAWLGPIKLPYILLFASLLSILWYVKGLIKKQVNLKSHYSFGPWLILASLLVSCI